MKSGFKKKKSDLVNSAVTKVFFFMYSRSLTSKNFSYKKWLFIIKREETKVIAKRKVRS